MQSRLVHSEYRPYTYDRFRMTNTSHQPPAAEDGVVFCYSKAQKQVDLKKVLFVVGSSMCAEGTVSRTLELYLCTRGV